MIKKILNLICIYLLITACNSPKDSYLSKKKQVDQFGNYLKDIHKININDSFNSPVFIFYPNNCGSCSVKLQNFISEILPLLNKPYAIFISSEKKTPEFINSKDFIVLTDTTEEIYNYGIINVFDMLYIYKAGKIDLKKELTEDHYDEIKKYLEKRLLKKESVI